MKVQSGGVEVIVVEALLNRHNASGVFNPFAGVKIASHRGETSRCEDAARFGSLWQNKEFILT